MSKQACEQLGVQCPPFSLHICRLLSERLIERGRELASSRVGRDAVLDDLFEAQAPPIQRLLLRAAILATPTHASLAGILDEPADVGALARLAERYPRLVQTDGQGAWTFHAGLRTFLLSRLARDEGAAGTPALHARAAAHFEEHEAWSTAIDHHLGALAWTDAARLLERHGDALLFRVSRERFQAQLEILGAFSRREAYGLIVLLLALAGWITTPLHGVSEAWVALGALLLFVLGGVLDRNSLRAGVDLGFLLFLGVVSSLSGVASAVKADRWLMTLLGPVLDVA